MKNLHKKIGAMVLAGMVVLGGVAAGGVNSFAASKGNISISNNMKDMHEQRVNSICKQLGSKVIKSGHSRKELDDSIKNNNNIDKKCYNVRYQNLPLMLYNLKRGNRKNIKILKIDSYYYLIQLN